MLHDDNENEKVKFVPAKERCDLSICILLILLWQIFLMITLRVFRYKNLFIYFASKICSVTIHDNSREGKTLEMVEPVSYSKRWLRPESALKLQTLDLGPHLNSIWDYRK